MEVLIKERGLWPESGLNAQCPGFKCQKGSTNCCCRRILFTQPDFQSQKSQLEEYITSQNHICDFYPKFHCELNFIEQYWGGAKWRYCSTPRTSDINEMKKNVLQSCFISAYSQGLNGAEAVWANKKFHSHRTLPPWMIEKAKEHMQDNNTAPN
ncbi:hypothetical protein M422DRAFT_159206 [Sphaerobolus stellatus SS14]|nr:hypothetical protein M422DRAFT_159206 [Sphaerobolus stellatus SS14]